MADAWDKVEGWLSALQRETSQPEAPLQVRSLQAHVAAVAVEFQAAKAAAGAAPRTTAGLSQIEGHVRSLLDDVEKALGSASARNWVERLGTQVGVGGWMGIGLLLLIVVFLAIFIGNIPYEQLRSPDGARPVLMLVAIITTVVFGGAMVFAALYSNEAPLAERFRLAREIFLVFSGVFGTVVGFHYAAAVSPLQKDPQPVQIERVATKDGKLVINVKGGTPPFEVKADFDGAPHSGTGDSPVAIALPPGMDVDSATVAKLTIKVSDKARVQSEPLLLTGFALKRLDWAAGQAVTATPPPGVPAPGSPAQPSAPPPSTVKR